MKKTDFPEKITQKSHTVTIKALYSDTDKSGAVHHGAYPIWFETGRTELLRANNLAYKDLEEAGVFFVVAALKIRYRRPAVYDEEMELETSCTNVTASKIEHSYRLTRCGDGVLLAEGSTILACVNGNGKVRRIPEFMYPQ
jgi:acyl-CoA thioester hydrolase